MNSQTECMASRVRVCAPNRQRSAATIYCFPHAGAAVPGSAVWQGQVGRSPVLAGLQYPGHGHRFREPLCASIEAIAADLIEALPSFELESAVFFGHSMGSLVAYEACRQLHARRQPLPQRLILSGRAAPHWRRTGVVPDTLPDDELIEYMKALGGMPPEVLDDTELCALLVPVARADFAACRRYQPLPAEPLPIDLVVYAGDEDDLDAEGLHAWSGYTRAGFQIRWFAGGHFYFDTSASPFLMALVADATDERTS